MATRPRLAVIVYGSLLDPTELDCLLEELTGRVWPVRVQGFERICNQTASWRSADGDQRAVLNVVRNEAAWCNALVVTDIRAAEFEAFRDRERGYRLTEVEPDDIDPYAPREVETKIETGVPAPAEQNLTLVTTGTNVDPDMAPVPGYLGKCLDGASQWGETFLAEFRATTTTNAGTDLPGTGPD